jgi:putative spermidine/putrescine transport system permease protein
MSARWTTLASRAIFTGAPWVVAVLGYIFLVGPIAIIMVASFGSGQEMHFPPRQLSLDLYAQFFSDPSWWWPALRSLAVAAVTSVLAILVTVPASYAISRSSMKGGKALELLFISPMLVPVITLGLGLYIFQSAARIDNSFAGVVLSHAALVVPFIFISVSAGLRHTDSQLESVALLMGASRLRIFFTVLLPQLKPSILVGALFAFLISFDEVVVAYFITGPETTTLPVKMYSALRWEVSPVLTAISSLLTVLSLAICVGIMLLRGSSSNKSND